MVDYEDIAKRAHKETTYRIQQALNNSTHIVKFFWDVTHGNPLPKDGYNHYRIRLNQQDDDPFLRIFIMLFIKLLALILSNPINLIRPAMSIKEQ